MIEELAKLLQRHLRISEDEALFTAICAVGGFSIDSLFFPTGIPTPTATILSGAGGYASYRWLKKRSFFQDWLLGRIDKLVAKGHLTPEKGKELKEKFIEKWANEHLGSDDRGASDDNEMLARTSPPQT